MSSRSKHRKIKSLYIWHRYAGIIAALLTLVLSITGIALNHTERLKLDSSFVESEWLLDWYGIQAPNEQTAFPLGKHWLTHMGDNLYVNKQLLAGNYTTPIGAIAFPHFLAVALKNKVLLLTHEGEVIEQLGELQGVPAGMEKIGQQKDGGIIVKAGQKHYVTNRDFLKWQEQQPVNPITWVESFTSPEVLQQQLSQQYRSNELPMERFMLDLHSGRLFGSWGPLVMDIAAVLLVFLAMSGFWLWTKQIIRKRQRRRKKLIVRHK